jgi:hypothetical protein
MGLHGLLKGTSKFVLRQKEGRAIRPRMEEVAMKYGWYLFHMTLSANYQFQISGNIT